MEATGKFVVIYINHLTGKEEKMVVEVYTKKPKSSHARTAFFKAMRKKSKNPYKEFGIISIVSSW